MTAVIYTQDTETWCDPCAMARDECGHYAPDDPRSDEAIFDNIAEWLDGDQKILTPTMLRRDDDANLFYRGKLNVLIGDPEASKTWIALAAIVVELRAGRRAMFVDADHNGKEGIIPRLILLGAPVDALRDRARFRYIEVADPEAYGQVVKSLDRWHPSVSVLDSHASIAEMHGYDDNSSGDMRRYNRTLTYPFTRNGGALILIDHMAKNETSRAHGGSGTLGKSAAYNGAVYRVSVKDEWSPATGGASILEVVKDRPGGVRANCAKPERGKRAFAGTFRLHAPRPGEIVQAWAIYTPGRDAETNAEAELVGRIARLPEAERKSASKAQKALGARREAVQAAFKVYEAQQPEAFTTEPEPDPETDPMF